MRTDEESQLSPVSAGAFLQQTTEDVSLPSLTVLVVWCSVLVVGVIGVWLPYPHPLPLPQLPVVQAEMLQVELTDAPLGEPGEEAPPAGGGSPVAVDKIRDVPPLPAVAAPSPAIAFALPVAGPVQIVEANAATYFQPAAPAVKNSVVGGGLGTTTDGTFGSGSGERLVWGRGAGKQPAPEYPRRAVIEGQQGAVLVRFSVGENGHVLAAEALQPSPWPLLNDAAVRTVRERWRFRPGAAHLYDVVIRFELEN